MTRQLRRVLVSGDLSPIELYSASVALVWGVWLLGPWATFGSSPAYRAMADIAPEWTWGAVFAAAGLWQVSRRDRGPAALLIAVLWSFVSAMFIAANWRGVPTVTYPALVLINVWIVLRMARWGN